MCVLADDIWVCISTHGRAVGGREGDSSEGSLLLGFSPRSYVTPGGGGLGACVQAWMRYASGRGQRAGHAPMSADYHIETLIR